MGGIVVKRKASGLLVPKPKPIYLIKDGKVFMKKIPRIKRPPANERT